MSHSLTSCFRFIGIDAERLPMLIRPSVSHDLERVKGFRPLWKPACAISGAGEEL